MLSTITALLLVLEVLAPIIFFLYYYSKSNETKRLSSNKADVKQLGEAQAELNARLEKVKKLEANLNEKVKTLDETKNDTSIVVNEEFDITESIDTMLALYGDVHTEINNIDATINNVELPEIKSIVYYLDTRLDIICNFKITKINITTKGIRVFGFSEDLAKYYSSLVINDLRVHLNPSTWKSEYTAKYNSLSPEFKQMFKEKLAAEISNLILPLNKLYRTREDLEFKREEAKNKSYAKESTLLLEQYKKQITDITLT